MIPNEYRRKYNRAVTAHCRWQRSQKRWAIFALLGLPEIFLASVLHASPGVLIPIAIQMILGGWRIFYADKQMQRYEGPLVDMDV
jgi:hypothetical protein